MGQTSDLPLAVDLDGTLILTDMSRVTIRRVVLPRPWLLPKLLWLEITGRRAAWKRELGRRLKFDPAELTYHEPFLAWLKEQKGNGREIILCTASERCVAEKIADYVGLFEDVMASDGVVNLRMEAKGKALAERYGKGNFAYAGNSSHDLKTWPYAGEVIVVNARKSTINALGDRPTLVFD
jgi:phosphoserine phosphatase